MKETVENTGKKQEASVIEINAVSFMYPESDRAVFSDLSIDLPGGVVSLVGRNGTGKSTLMLLAGGRLLPTKGTVRILGRSTEELRTEEERNAVASFIYQNMEFETEEPVGELLEFVWNGGNHDKSDQTLLPLLVNTFELDPLLGKRTQELSKGELQRTIIAFSLLYGSPVILMDEPVFALEQYQKEYTMEFLMDYSKRFGTHIYYSVHELEISKKYSRTVVLFGKDRPPTAGAAEEILTRENIEEAFQLPYSMLHKKEHVFREMLRKL